MNQLMQKNRDKLFKNGKQFQRVFGVPLNNYIDPITGFDIVKFDEFLKTPDNVSTADFLEGKFGVEAKNLIESLI